MTVTAVASATPNHGDPHAARIAALEGMAAQIAAMYAEVAAEAAARGLHVDAALDSHLFLAAGYLNKVRDNFASDAVFETDAERDELGAYRNELVSASPVFTASADLLAAHGMRPAVQYAWTN